LPVFTTRHLPLHIVITSETEIRNVETVSDSIRSPGLRLYIVPVRRDSVRPAIGNRFRGGPVNERKETGVSVVGGNGRTNGGRHIIRKRRRFSTRSMGYVNGSETRHN